MATMHDDIWYYIVWLLGEATLHTAQFIVLKGDQKTFVIEHWIKIVSICNQQMAPQQSLNET